MKTIVIEQNSRALDAALAALRRGGLVIYPTETSYGMGIDAANRQALKNLFAAKRRAPEKHVSIAFTSARMAKKCLALDRDAMALVRAFMPGPLTLVVRGIGFRIPDHAFARQIIAQLGRPITATSANISNEAPLYKIRDVIAAFDGVADVIIDAGDLPRRKVSTVFDLDANKILRRGPVTRRAIVSALSAYTV